jgi:hypothetical protein
MPGSSSSHATPSSPCSTGVVATYRDRPEHFNTTETIGGNIPETVIEGTNSSTTATLGVAISYSIKKVKWGIDGTGSITDSSTHEVSATYAVPHTLYNRVNYDELGLNCFDIHILQPYSFYDLRSRLKPDSGSAFSLTTTSTRLGKSAGTPQTVR